MEDNKRGTRKRIVRRPSEGHAEKVDYSTSRSFDSGERPHRSSYGDKPRSYGNDRPRRDGEGRPQNGERRSYGSSNNNDRPRRSGYGKPSFNGNGNSNGSYSKPGYKGGSKPGARKPYSKQRSQADEGMNAMLSRKPQVNGRYSDDDTAPTEIKEVVRLNKFIANSGVCSRREADTLIQSGVVTVNGEVVTELGTKVNILTDDIRFNGQRLKGEEKVYIVMNKPKG